MRVILASACLLGFSCRYKGDHCRCDRLLSLSEDHILIPVCPEQMGGLPTPRIPSERVRDRVLTREGKDVTENYQKGAETVLAIARLNHAEFAVLKANSPACGKGIIYDGTFTGAKKEGNGVAAELLLSHGIPVYTEEEDWPAEEKEKE